jgi:hypothetical protein
MCGGQVRYRYTYLYNKEKNGYLCTGCWDRLVAEKEE